MFLFLRELKILFQLNAIINFGITNDTYCKVYKIKTDFT